MRRIKRIIAALVLAAASLGACVGVGQTPALAAYNPAPAEDICKYMAPAYPWVTTRWTNFYFMGYDHVGCTYRNMRTQQYLCVFFNRSTGATAWVSCPTP